MRATLFSVAVLLCACGLLVAEKTTETITVYVDSNLCAHLMLGPINEARINCSQKTYKEGSDAVLVRLTDNMILLPNKDKEIKKLVGHLAAVTGEINPRGSDGGTIKIQAVKPLEVKDIPAGDPAMKWLDVRMHKAAPGSPALYEKVRHELAMMPYIGYYDYISFAMYGNKVLLNGWTVRITNRSEAYNRVKGIPGVEQIVNNIEVLPMGAADNQIRAGVMAALQPQLSTYFWGSGSDIKIIVKNGDVILLGQVRNKGDYDIAGIRANGVRNAFKVFNMLTVAEKPEKKS